MYICMYTYMCVCLCVRACVCYFVIAIVNLFLFNSLEVNGKLNYYKGLADAWDENEMRLGKCGSHLGLKGSRNIKSNLVCKDSFSNYDPSILPPPSSLPSVSPIQPNMDSKLSFLSFFPTLYFTLFISSSTE